MNLDNLTEKIQTGVVKITLLKNKKPFVSASGFLLKNELITNDHLFDEYETAEEVKILYLRNDQYFELHLPKAQFLNLVLSRSKEYDFAILRIPPSLPTNLYRFEIKKNFSPRIGLKIALLGFPFEIEEINLSDGLISGFHDRNKKEKMMRISANVNQGNSGGPLFDISDGEVIGIITGKHPGIIKEQFDLLEKSLLHNSEALKPYIYFIRTGNINIIEGIQKTQLSNLIIVKNLRRCANVGIGYAFPMHHVCEELKKLRKPASAAGVPK